MQLLRPVRWDSAYDWCSTAGEMVREPRGEWCEDIAERAGPPAPAL